ncbi:MAG: amylo-alpha-1,6-glucosidase [Desulfovibrio sp.]|jgi:predicted glycogen debranching enzyme|nr:amylo-alpha-1,6-glucosidase [Desulfovibrio sp.]
MRFCFDKAACQNTRRALRKEWLLANGLGDYASSSILCCNTRKYHGLLTVNTRRGRHVLLSALEESVSGADKEFFLSTRRHPDILHPDGHQYLDRFEFDSWPEFTYRIGDVEIRREMFLQRGVSRLVLRYFVKADSTPPPLTLTLKPLLAYRHFHALTRANLTLRTQTQPLENGFSIAPYEELPELFVQVSGEHVFYPSPDWFYNVDYFQEAERGFPSEEDLFQPGVLKMPLTAGESVYVTVGIGFCGEDPEAVWQAENTRMRAEHDGREGLLDSLGRTGRQFCTTTTSGRSAILAGYHWFDSWSRDALISLPGLTFLNNNSEFGLEVLKQTAGALRNGLAPNYFVEDGENAYNSVDAALWYSFALQCFLKENPEAIGLVREQFWPAVKSIVKGYRQGPGMDIFVDEFGLLHAGNAGTQLTWMDAKAGGRPVTPRHGCPVEINALWYNTLAFADYLASCFREPEWEATKILRELRTAFFERFWVARGEGYLGDVWREGTLDQAIRPNQIFAVSLPYPILEEQYQACVVECVRNRLLTPYGLRTLAPDDPAYRGSYEGPPDARDAAYHQGTVWPWLLGHYGDALLRTVWNVEGAAEALLDTLMPLFSDHLADAGLGGISEIFDASPPYRPNGCINQAWSVAECFRLLRSLKKAAPKVYDDWEKRIAYRLANPPSGDTAGVCRALMTSA